MYSGDSLCPSGILSSSKRQLLSSGAVSEASRAPSWAQAAPQGRPRVAAPVLEPAEGQTCHPPRPATWRSWGPPERLT